MAANDRSRRFEQLVLPHLDAAHNLACWLTRDEDDAREAVQEAFLRAYKFFDSLRGDDAKAWFLAIVRNACFTLHGRNRPPGIMEVLDEELHGEELIAPGPTPEAAAMESADRELVNAALAGLPVEFREALVLRELEGLSYREIALVANIPIGTVMSRLARGRRLLQEAILQRLGKEKTNAMR